MSPGTEPHCLIADNRSIGTVFGRGGEGIFEQLVWGSIRLHNYMMNPDGYVEFRELREGLTFADAAVKYQPDFRDVVLWLVQRDVEGGNTALPFVWQHAHVIKTRPHASPDSIEYGLSMVDQASDVSHI